jgi:hypothetical protein
MTVLHVRGDQTVAALKASVEAREGAECWYGGSALDDTATLAASALQDDALIHILVCPSSHAHKHMYASRYE